MPPACSLFFLLLLLLLPFFAAPLSAALSLLPLNPLLTRSQLALGARLPFLPGPHASSGQLSTPKLT